MGEMDVPQVTQYVLQAPCQGNKTIVLNMIFPVHPFYFQKRVFIYMKLSNTIFRSKFDEDDDEERLLINELLLIMNYCRNEFG